MSCGQAKNTVPFQDPVAPAIFFYRDKNFQGPTLVLTGSCSNFATKGFNDQASSVIVKKGKWTCFQDHCYKGKPLGLGKYGYESLDTLGDDTLSSVRLDSK